MKKKSALRDVATLASVSVGTVSKYLNGGEVKKANRISIQNAIEVLNYSPNSVARNFARGKSNVIKLMIITESPIVTSTWVYEQPIIQALNDTISMTDFSLHIQIASKDKNDENVKNIESCIMSKSFDGIALLSAWEIEHSILSILDYYNFPFVAIGSGGDTKRNDTVDFNNSSPIYELVTKLCAEGHRRFALIGGFKEQIHMMKREKGYRNALRDAGIEVDKQRILNGDYSPKSGFDTALKLMQQKNPPTAIICGNDNIAVGAIKAIRTLGLRVPHDVSVSGFDNSVVAEIFEPTITTVKVPAYEMGRTAMTYLLRKLSNSSYVIPNTVLESELLIKESTGVARDFA